MGRFWSFVQLVRMLKRETEHAEEAQMHALMKELSFNEQEVEQFRTIFRSWIKAEVEKAAEVDETASSEGLQLPGIRRMVRFLDGGVLKFFGFLRLMKWFLQTNFAGINDAAAK